MVEVKTLITWDTEFSADSVEWCPIDSLHHVFVCGTYQLKQDDNQTATRNGCLHLMSLVNTDQVIVQLESLEMPAVLDCKWAPITVQDNVLLAVANAIGQVCIFRLIQGDGISKEKLIEETTLDLPRMDCEPPELLTLSLDWSVSRDNVKVVASDSRGRITVLCLDENGLHVEHNWTAHNFEAWTVHFDAFDSQVCYTGGDDCKLRVYDLRTGVDTARQMISSHSAGVTSLTCSKNGEHIMLSGSYDEQVLLWDTRQFKRPVESVSVGGGIWRLRWKPITENQVLAACMYNGFHLLELQPSLQTVAEYSEHESIAYGADWSHLSDLKQFPQFLSSENNLIATCSFYDHKLCVSSVSKR